MLREEVQLFVDEAIEKMEKSIAHLETELLKIRAGKASPALVQGISVDYYGSQTPLNQVANIMAQDSKTLVIQPWEKKMIDPIVKAIMAANIGVTPMEDGELVRLNLPPLTEDRRRDFVKRVKAMGEDSKIGLRTARHNVIGEIKAMQKDGLEEDIAKRAEDKIDELTKKYYDLVDKHVKAKEDQIMTV